MYWLVVTFSFHSQPSHCPSRFTFSPPQSFNVGFGPLLPLFWTSHGPYLAICLGRILLLSGICPPISITPTNQVLGFEGGLDLGVGSAHRFPICLYLLIWAPSPDCLFPVPFIPPVLQKPTIKFLLFLEQLGPAQFCRPCNFSFLFWASSFGPEASHSCF